jgi:hypothetical protein
MKSWKKILIKKTCKSKKKKKNSKKRRRMSIKFNRENPRRMKFEKKKQFKKLSQTKQIAIKRIRIKFKRL